MFILYIWLATQFLQRQSNLTCARVERKFQDVILHSCPALSLEVSTHETCALNTESQASPEMGDFPVTKMSFKDVIRPTEFNGT